MSGLADCLARAELRTVSDVFSQRRGERGSCAADNKDTTIAFLGVLCVLRENGLRSSAEVPRFLLRATIQAWTAASSYSVMPTQAGIHFIPGA
jgi:hypothetical protein